MKKLTAILLCLILCMGLALTASAAEYPPVFDYAQLMEDSDARALCERTQQLSQKHGIDIVFLTVPSLNGKSAQDYADDYYDYNGYGEDGVLFLVAMAERKYHISTCGRVIEYLSDDVIYDLEEDFVPYLSNGNYYGAFDDFLTGVDIFMTDDPVGDAIACILMGSVAGLVVAGISVLIMRLTMNTKVSQHAATDYLEDGSYRLYENTDTFLYSRTTRQRRPEPEDNDSSVHTSSSGRSHGGHGGSF